MKEIKTGIFTVENSDGSIYMIGDLHGDYQCMVHCLVDLCKVCDIDNVYDDKENDFKKREHLKWITNNNSIIIFCGDIIHRKRFADHVLDDECSDIFMINTLVRLKKEAKENQGDIIIIAGNHEIMNILNPSDTTYTSKKNIELNEKNFTNKKFVNEYIANSYAWIKLNNILITHGGLCSDYLRYLDENNVFDNKIMTGSGNIFNKIMLGGKNITSKDEIIGFINDQYKSFFTNFDKDNMKNNKIAYDLFVKYDLTQKNKLNMFWCREWGYSGIDCEKFKNILNKVGCNKMIIAHCPQFISPDYPKMINFECIDNESDSYNIARIDLGMSRCFDYNKSDNFMYYLSNNYNRKISVLKLRLNSESNNLYFDINDIITEKLSCIQYLLIKYGKTKEEWDNLNISSTWLGFEHIEKLINSITNGDNCSCNSNNDKFVIEKNKKKKRPNGELNDIVEQPNNTCIDKSDSKQVILCLLSEVINNQDNLKSVNQFRELTEKIKTI